MTTYNKGDIVIVPFPFSDQTATKKRPAVIISSNQYNNTSPDIVIMAVTSKTDKNLTTGECLINNWQDAGLLKPSAIKPAISTIEQTLVLKKLGKLSQKEGLQASEWVKLSSFISPSACK
ncbi:MAG: type II toxin-antitoxin system PemK/MazF family toxin [Candidatus Brocadia sp. WS118]|nr:MAG: type II toxin-antitoxin system PemK/MazF family toxin [Candidatus Brocadia sp. WS118]